MADFTEKLRTDLVEQFKEKNVIDYLLQAIGIQLNDVFNYFTALQNERGVFSSVGQQLDGVGDIVCLTRMEASDLACVNRSVFYLDDEVYRGYLVYKIWKNTNNCTYYDVIRALRMFWDKALYYSENPEIPATMIFETEELTPEDNVQALLNAPLIKAAGVGILVKATTRTDLPPSVLPIGSALCRNFQSTALPEMRSDAAAEAEDKEVEI